MTGSKPPHGNDVVDPFALFCAYHLGLFPDGKKRDGNIHEVARALGRAAGVAVDKDVVEAALARHGLRPEDLMNKDFDLISAREDIWASPPGVDLFSIAAMHWDLLRAAADRPRDWEAERAADELENARVFGGSRERD